MGYFVCNCYFHHSNHLIRLMTFQCLKNKAFKQKLWLTLSRVHRIRISAVTPVLIINPIRIRLL